MWLAFACALAAPGASSSAPAAASASANLVVAISVGTTRQSPVISSGASVRVATLNFKAGASVETIGPDLADNVSIRFELPAGLHWGTDAPDATEICTATASTADCRPGLILDPQNFGARAVGWLWDVVADAPGSYQLKAEIVSSSADDPDPSNNTSNVTVVVTRAVTASAAKLAPAKPKAGAVLSARVAVRAGVEPITPTAVACTGAFGGKKVAGSPRGRPGTAQCTYVTPRSARGKTLQGTVAFTAENKRLSRRFAVKLR